jgi:selenide,water dikinase
VRRDKASGLSATIWLDDVPVLRQAWDYVREGIAPGGTHANWRFLNDWTSYGDGVEKADQLVMCDAQTSGGLLMAVAPEKAERLVGALERRGVLRASVVGRMEAGEPGRMRVVRKPE